MPWKSKVLRKLIKLSKKKESPLTDIHKLSQKLGSVIQENTTHLINWMWQKECNKNWPRPGGVDSIHHKLFVMECTNLWRCRWGIEREAGVSNTACYQPALLARKQAVWTLSLWAPWWEEPEKQAWVKAWSRMWKTSSFWKTWFIWHLLCAHRTI